MEVTESFHYVGILSLGEWKKVFSLFLEERRAKLGLAHLRMIFLP